MTTPFAPSLLSGRSSRLAMWLLTSAAALGWAMQVESPIPDWPSVMYVTVVFCLLNVLDLRLLVGQTVRIDVMAAVGAISLGNPSAALVSLAVGSMTARLMSRGDSYPNEILDAFGDVGRRVAVLGATMVILGPARLALISRADLPSVGWLLVGGLVYVTLDSLTLPLSTGTPVDVGYSESVSSVLRTLAFIYFGQACLGAAAVLSFHTLGLVGVLVLSVIGLVLTNSVGLYLRVRRAYDDVIRVLAGLAELSTPMFQGHAETTAVVSTIVGRQLGLGGRSLERLRYAALLHDLGMLSEEQAQAGMIPQARHEETGAAIVEGIPPLANVADIVRYHHGIPSGVDSPTLDPDTLTCARIVRVVSDYDYYRRGASKGAQVEGPPPEASKYGAPELEILQRAIRAWEDMPR